MQEFNIRFCSFQDVQDFVSLATQYSFPIIVGSENYQVNGTSLMGMFSLDYSRPLKAMADCRGGELDDFRQKLERFLVK